MSGSADLVVAGLGIRIQPRWVSLTPLDRPLSTHVAPRGPSHRARCRGESFRSRYRSCTGTSCRAPQPFVECISLSTALASSARAPRPTGSSSVRASRLQDRPSGTPPPQREESAAALKGISQLLQASASRSASASSSCPLWNRKSRASPIRRILAHDHGAQHAPCDHLVLARPTRSRPPSPCPTSGQPAGQHGSCQCGPARVHQASLRMVCTSVIVASIRRDHPAADPRWTAGQSVVRVGAIGGFVPSLSSRREPSVRAVSVGPGPRRLRCGRCSRGRIPGRPASTTFASLVDATRSPSLSMRSVRLAKAKNVAWRGVTFPRRPMRRLRRVSRSTRNTKLHLVPQGGRPTSGSRSPYAESSGGGRGFGPAGSCGVADIRVLPVRSRISWGTAHWSASFAIGPTSRSRRTTRRALPTRRSAGV